MSNKTEQPTPKKLRDARKKGNVPVSKDANSIVTFLIGLMVIFLIAPWLRDSFIELYQRVVVGASVQNLDLATLNAIVDRSVMLSFKMALAAVVPIAMIGTLVGYMQAGPVFSTEKITPKLEKLNPMQALKRMFGVQGLFELAKTFLKLGALFAIGAGTIWGSMEVLLQLGYLPLDAIAIEGGKIAKAFLVGVAIVFFGVGLLDLGFTRWKHRKDLMMTKDEVKREFKEQEGSPEIKGKRRELYHDMMNGNPAQAIKTADAVVVNPTHYAVIVEYNREEMAAPKVTAKGVDKDAAAIRRLARRRDVPIVRDVPLARALYEVRVDRYVPEELFEAIGQVLLFAWKIKRDGEDSFVSTRVSGGLS